MMGDAAGVIVLHGGVVGPVLGPVRPQRAEGALGPRVVPALPGPHVVQGDDIMGLQATWS